MMYSIAPLFCRPWTLNGIPARLIESHYENNYGGAVRRLNALTSEIQALDPATAAPEALRRLKRDEFALLNSTLLH
ncbi:MAG TPA: superoxide dismutase, partial [Burkholderiaceae bacterium]